MAMSSRTYSSQASNKKSAVDQDSSQKNQDIAVSLPEDVDMPDNQEILDEDGLIIQAANRVVAKNAKVNTALSGQFSYANQRDDDGIGGKKSLSLSDLRKRFSFSWKRFGQRFGLFFLMFGILTLVGISLVGTWILDQWNGAPDPNEILDGTATESSVVLARDGVTELFKFFDKENRDVVDIMEPDTSVEDWNPNNQNYIPRRMQLAILALEDENFYRNEDGIPWSNLVGASITCLTSALADCRGASGISQQLVKNVTSDDESTLNRKIRELFTALKLGNNEDFDKERILNLYLNTVGFGRNAHGVEAASQSYFGKEIKDIRMHEACFLASLPQDPVIYNNALRDPESEVYQQLMIRKDSCLQKLATVDIRPGIDLYLTEAEVDELQELPLEIIDFRRDRKFPHFLDFVERELQDKKLLADTPQATQDALATGGYRIVTTIDPALQQRVEEIFVARRQSSIENWGANNGAGLVLDGPTGQIIAMMGSIDYNNTDIDGQVNITTSAQAPGSSFKPYVYAAALEKNFHPSTVFADNRTDFGGGYTPSNFDRRFRGPVTMRYSLQSSLNIPAVKALYLASGSGNYSNGTQGVNEVLRVSEAMGVRYPFRDRCSVSMALGACEVTMVSHATGMNTFGQSGRLRTATPFISITKVDEDGNKKDIYKERMEGEKNQVPYPQNDRAIDPAIANQMADIMSDYQARTEAFGRLRSNLEVSGWRVAAKSGTSTLSRGGREFASDLWLVGYSPLYTTTVWVGNTKNDPVIDSATGSSTSALIWKDIMTHLHSGKQRVDFPKDGLGRYSVNCSAGQYCSGTEWLTPGQYQALNRSNGRIVQQDYNPRDHSIFDFRDEIFFRTMKVHKADGKLAPVGTPENLLQEIECVEAPSAFPLDGDWLNPVQEDATNRFSGRQCPTDASEYSPDIVPVITSNLFSSSLSPAEIEVSAASTYSGVSITSISVSIGEESVATSTSNSLVYDATAQSGTATVIIEVEDSLGNITTASYTDVEFTFLPLSSPDIAVIAPNCSPDPVTVGDVLNCNFAIPNGRSLPTGFKMFVGTNTTGAACTLNGSTVICNSIPTSGVSVGTATVQGGVTPTAVFATTVEVQ